MDIAHTEHYLPNLRYVAPVFDGAKPEWQGDLFSYTGGALYVPLSEDNVALLKYRAGKKMPLEDAHSLDYDFDLTRSVANFTLPEGQEQAAPLLLNSPNITIGDASFVPSPSLRSYLVLLRHKHELSCCDDRTRKETLLNDITLCGYTLPPVVSGGSTASFGHGYSGDVLMMQTLLGWRAFHIKGAYRHDHDFSHFVTAKQSHVIQPSHLSYFNQDMGLLGGTKNFPSKVCNAQRDKAVAYFTQKWMAESEGNGTRWNLVFEQRGVTEDFALAGILVTNKDGAPSDEGVVFTRGANQNHYHDLGSENIYIPMLRKRDARGITHVTLYPDAAQAIDFTFVGDVEKMQPRSLPIELRSELDLHFDRPLPRWDSPVTIAVNSGPL